MGWKNYSSTRTLVLQQIFLATATLQVPQLIRTPPLSHCAWEHAVKIWCYKAGYTVKQSAPRPAKASGIPPKPFEHTEKKLCTNYAIPLSSYFIFTALLHRLAQDLFTLVFNSDEKRTFIAMSQHKGIVKHTNRLLLDETKLPDVLQPLMSVRSPGTSQIWADTKSHTSKKQTHQRNAASPRLVLGTICFIPQTCSPDAAVFVSVALEA